MSNIQSKRFSKRLSTAKYINSSEKSEEAKSMSIKDSGINLHGKKQKRVGNKESKNISTGTSNSDFNKKTQKNDSTIDAQAAGTTNFDFNKKTQKNDTTVDPQAADKIKKRIETSRIIDPSTVVAPLGDNSVIDMSLFESDTPGKRSGTHVQTVSMASKVKPALTKNFGKQVSSLKSHAAYDRSQSDTLANKSISNIVDFGRSEKVGKKGSVDYNSVDCKRMEYIRNQQKDPRSAAYLNSRNSKFRYQEDYLGTPKSGFKSSVSGRLQPKEAYSGTPKSGFKSSVSGRLQPKEAYAVHATSFENSSDGKSHSKKGNAMHTSSSGSAPAG